MQQSDEPCLYHITHVDNLASIIAAQGLWSDAEMVASGGPAAPIGMQGIKQRRLRLPVGCHPGLMVGACVPFYLCPRSVMLYLLHRGSHPEVIYKGGQGPIVHLEARLHEVVAWADRQGARWAFSLSNAAASYTPFFSHVHQLGQLNWEAIQGRDWRNPEIMEGKQAEFLVERFLSLSLVRRIGVASTGVASTVRSILGSSAVEGPGVAQHGAGCRPAAEHHGPRAGGVVGDGRGVAGGRRSGGDHHGRA